MLHERQGGGQEGGLVFRLLTVRKYDPGTPDSPPPGSCVTEESHLQINLLYCSIFPPFSPVYRLLKEIEINHIYRLTASHFDSCGLKLWLCCQESQRFHPNVPHYLLKLPLEKSSCEAVSLLLLTQLLGFHSESGKHALFVLWGTRNAVTSTSSALAVIYSGRMSLMSQKMWPPDVPVHRPAPSHKDGNKKSW